MSIMCDLHGSQDPGGAVRCPRFTRLLGPEWRRRRVPDLRHLPCRVRHFWDCALARGMRSPFIFWSTLGRRACLRGLPGLYWRCADRQGLRWNQTDWSTARLEGDLNSISAMGGNRANQRMTAFRTRRSAPGLHKWARCPPAALRLVLIRHQNRPDAPRAMNCPRGASAAVPSSKTGWPRSSVITGQPVTSSPS